MIFRTHENKKNRVTNTDCIILVKQTPEIGTQVRLRENNNKNQGQTRIGTTIHLTLSNGLPIVCLAIFFWKKILKITLNCRRETVGFPFTPANRVFTRRRKTLFGLPTVIVVQIKLPNNCIFTLYFGKINN